MRNATAKRLRFVIVPDHYEPLGRLDGAALGADGIMFQFKIGRSATMPISGFSGFSVPPLKPSGGGGQSGTMAADIPDLAARPPPPVLESCSSDVSVSGSGSVTQQLTPVRMNPKTGGGQLQGGAAAVAAAAVAVNSSPSSGAPSATTNPTASTNTSAVGVSASSAATATSAPALEQAQALTSASSSGDVAFVNTAALQKWKSIMAMTVAKTPASGDYEAAYRAKMDQLLQFIRKKMSGNEKLDVRYIGLEALFPGCKKLPRDTVTLQLLLVLPLPPEPPEQEEQEEEEGATAVGGDKVVAGEGTVSGKGVRALLRAVQEGVARDPSEHDVRLRITEAVGATAAAELLATPTEPVAAVGSDTSKGAGGVDKSPSVAGAAVDASTSSRFDAVLVVSEATPMLGALRDDWKYSGPVFVVSDAADAFEELSAHHQGLQGAFSLTFLPSKMHAYSSAVKGLAEKSRRARSTGAGAGTGTGTAAVTATTGSGGSLPKPSSSKAIIKQYQYSRITMSENKSNPKWCYLRSDKHYSLRRPLHLEFSWISCDAWLLDEWISILFRRCSHFSLRIIQLPEFFFSDSIQLHSFRAQPYIQIPCTYAVGSNKTTCVGRGDGSGGAGTVGLTAVGAGFAGESPNYHFISPVLIVERIFLRAQAIDWIEDDSQPTDWHSVGVPIPSTVYLNGAHYDIHNRSHLELDAHDTSFRFGEELVEREAVVENVDGSGTGVGAGFCHDAHAEASPGPGPCPGPGPGPGAVDVAPLSPLPPQATLVTPNPTSTSSANPSPAVRPAATSALTDALTESLSRKGSRAPYPLAEAISSQPFPGTKAGLEKVPKATSKAGVTSTSTSTGGLTRTATSLANPNPNSNINAKRSDRDRQYILRLGNGGLRVGSGGFIWLLNMAVNINELKTEDEKKLAFPVDERKETGLAKLHEFQVLCTDVGIVLDILNEVIDISCNMVTSRRQQRALEQGLARAAAKASRETVPVPAMAVPVTVVETLPEVEARGAGHDVTEATASASAPVSPEAPMSAVVPAAGVPSGSTDAAKEGPEVGETGAPLTLAVDGVPVAHEDSEPTEPCRLADTSDSVDSL